MSNPADEGGSADVVCAACSRPITQEERVLKVVHETYRDDGRLAAAKPCGQLIHRGCRDSTIQDCPCGDDRGTVKYSETDEDFDAAAAMLDDEVVDEEPEEESAFEAIPSTTQTYSAVSDDSIAYLPPAVAGRGAPSTPVADDPIGCYEPGQDQESTSSSEEDWNLYFGSELDDDVCAECGLPISPYELTLAVCHSWTGIDGTVLSRTCGCRVHRSVLGNSAVITHCLHGPRGSMITYVDDGGTGPGQPDNPSSSSGEDSGPSDFFGSELEDDVCAECELPISPHELSLAVCHTWTEADGTVQSRNCGCRVHRPVLGDTPLITQCLHGPRATVITYVDDGRNALAQVGGGI